MNDIVKIIVNSNNDVEKLKGLRKYWIDNFKSMDEQKKDLLEFNILKARRRVDDKETK